MESCHHPFQQVFHMRWQWARPFSNLACLEKSKQQHSLDLAVGSPTTITCHPIKQRL